MILSRQEAVENIRLSELTRSTSLAGKLEFMKQPFIVHLTPPHKPLHYSLAYYSTSTGSLFLYERLDNGGLGIGAADNVRFLSVAQVSPDRATSVSAVRIIVVGADSHIAVAAGGGVVVVYDVAASRIIATHSRHKGADVTCIAVDAQSGRIISGDSSGVVVVADSGCMPVGIAPVGGLASGFRSLVKGFGAASTSSGSAGPVRDMPTTTVVGLDPPAAIVQLSLAPSSSDDLTCLVSTTTRACLLRIPAAARGGALGKVAVECSAVGKKPRDGDFGAAFEPTSCSAAGPSKRLAFASRPAKRMWILDVDSASVLSTVK